MMDVVEKFSSNGFYMPGGAGKGGTDTCLRHLGRFLPSSKLEALTGEIFYHEVLGELHRTDTHRLLHPWEQFTLIRAG